MPDKFVKAGPQGRVEQLYDYLKGTEAEIIYPLEKFISLKGNGCLYFKLDTHWNTAGALYGYEELMTAIKKDYPDLKTLKRDDYKIESIPENGGDLLNMLNVSFGRIKIRDNQTLRISPKFNYGYEYIKNEGVDGVETFNETPLNDLKMYALRDSFFSLMQELTAQTFAETNLTWYYDFNKIYPELKKEKPDIFVQETLERFIEQAFLTGGEPSEEVKADAI